MKIIKTKNKHFFEPNYYRYPGASEEDCVEMNTSRKSKSDVEPRLNSQAKEALKSLMNLYLEKGEYRHAVNLCEDLKKEGIGDFDPLIAKKYVELLDRLREEHVDQIKNKKSPSKSKQQDRPNLENFAMDPKLEKKIEYIIHRVDDKKGSYSLLLHGPPGVGKTELSRCIAGELGWEHKELNSEVVSKWVGETEKKIKEFFEKSRDEGQCVIVVDEFESFGYDRQKAVRSWEYGKSGEMLQQIEKTVREGEEILLIAITNFIDKIDLAIKRKGRINDKIKISEPDSEQRKKIFKIKIDSSDFEVEGDLNYDMFAERSKDLTGADIHHIVINKVDEILFNDDECDTVNDEIILKAIESVKSEDNKKENSMQYI